MLPNNEHISWQLFQGFFFHLTCKDVNPKDENLSSPYSFSIVGVQLWNNAKANVEMYESFFAFRSL